MNPAIISFLVSLATAALVEFPLGKALRRHSVVFYAVAAVATAVFAWSYLTGFKYPPLRWYTIMFQKAYLATLFLLIVMYIGVLPANSGLRQRLSPIRGELSILSFILYLGHIVVYLPIYWPRLGQLLSAGSNVATSLVVALVLTVVFLVLGVTSFKTVHKAMDNKVWKLVQKGAYIMMALLMVHIGFVLGRSAFSNPGSLAMASLLVYLVAIGLYAVLRVLRAVRSAEARHR